MNKMISIEGNIGSGKSTLIDKLKQQLNDISFIDEPVSEWKQIKDKKGDDILSKFYNDQEKYAFPFQMMAYISRLAMVKKSIKENKQHMISERSLYTDKYVFAKMLYDDNKLGECEYQIYNKWFETFSEISELTHIIYINTSPSTCFKRVNLRAREGEDKISFEYLSNCNDYHNEMIKHFINNNISVIELDGEENVFDDNTITNWVNKIKAFISNTNNDVHEISINI